MKKVNLSDKFQISPLVHGHWRLNDWKLTDNQLLSLTEQVIELGITTFDHADIYGNYSCEEKFGSILKSNPSLRKRIEIVTKCGIKIMSNKYPERKIPHYDYSFDHIVSSADNSLKNLGTDYIDLLLLHRPSPFFNPEEAARAFNHLAEEGKVLHFGVSNFTPLQFESFDSHCYDKLVTNQIKISPAQLEHFDNGNIDYCLKEFIVPMAWSPVAQGKLLLPSDEKGIRILKVLKEIAEEHNTKADTIVYSWLLSHPLTIVPIIGSCKIERIKHAVGAIDIKLTTEQWFRIYTASTGEDVP